MKALVGLLVVALAGYLAFAFIPPYFTKYQFADDVTSIARFDGPTSKSEDAIREEVMQKAKEYELPLAPEQVHVTRGNQQVTISADYRQVVSLIGGKKVYLTFHVKSDR